MIGVEVCERCGFHRDEWNEQDAERTLAHTEDLLDLWTVDAEGELDHKLLERRIDDVKNIAAAVDLFDKVHHLMHGLVAIADVRRAAHDAVPRQRGSVAQISRSDGGIPKTPVDRASIGRRGVEGDVQSARVHHGRPWQALCLWSSEVLADLAADGHPIEAGNAGENITISGVDWSTMRAGTIIEIGAGPDAVRCQMSAPATPCKKNAQWFRDGDIAQMSHELNPGRSRWYASVTRPGVISVGDPVVVSP